MPETENKFHQRNKQNDNQITVRANNFFDSLNNEEQPTPKRKYINQAIESNFKSFLKDHSNQAKFEKYLLNLKSFDIDWLHFYI